MKNSSPKTLIGLFLIPMVLVILSAIALLAWESTKGFPSSELVLQISLYLLGVLGVAVVISLFAHLGYLFGRRLIMAAGGLGSLYLTGYLLKFLYYPVLPFPDWSIGGITLNGLQVKGIIIYLGCLVIAWGLALMYFGLKYDYERAAEPAPDEPAAK